MTTENEKEIEIYICKDCGNECLENYCVDCESNNVQKDKKLK